MGAEQEKIRAIKRGKKTLIKNEDLLKPRTGFKPWEKVTDLKLIDGKPKMTEKEQLNRIEGFTLGYFNHLFCLIDDMLII